MNKSIYLIAILGAIFFANCANDDADDVYVSNEDHNWFKIEDKPGRFNQAAYKAYEQWGCPVFVNDTVWREDRGLDKYGNPYIHYEVLNVGYSVSSNIYKEFVLSSDTNTMLEAVALLEEKVFPVLKEIDKMPLSILLVDTLYLTTDPAKVQPGRPYTGREALVVGLVQLTEAPVPGGTNNISLSVMDDKDRAMWAGRLIAARIEPTISAEYADKLEKFYSYTTSKGGKYGSKMYKDDPWYSSYPAGNPYNKYTDVIALGFLSWRLYDAHIEDLIMGKSSVGRILPSYEDDIRDYIAAIYIFGDDKFKEVYEVNLETGKNKVLWDKYVYMKDLLQSAGFIE